jgi:2-methylcitrate dehydratase PrpD/citrate lyase beta subunit
MASTSDTPGATPLDPSATARLAAFAAGLRIEDIPAPVLRRTEDLLADWLGSALAGQGARPVRAIAAFARAMGPADGPSELLVGGGRSSPYFAAMVNAAASHVAEQDDVHNGAVFHPATVVFPAALALAQSLGASGARLLAASVAGYEVGIRVGEFLGRSHYKVFHTTGTAGTLAAAAAAGHLLGLDAARMRHAFGSAGTQSAGLWEFLRTAADSKQLHTAHAASAGLMSALLAQDGFTGAAEILEGPQGLAAGMSRDADASRLADGLGTRWAVAETSFKFHASCRHTHPAADAMLQVVRAHGLRPDDIARVVARVHQGAIDVLGPVVRPATVHQSKFSMGTVLALAARFGRASLADFDAHYADPETAALAARVAMERDDEVDAAYPRRWIGKITVHTADGRVLEGRVDEPKGDPGNTLDRAEVTDKALRLAAYGGTPADAAARALERVWALAGAPVVETLVDASAAGASASVPPSPAGPAARSAIARARTFLFVPADRPERIAKALASGAGAVVVDLEDAVAPDAKDAARAGLDAVFAGFDAAARGRLLVRLNAVGTPWYDDDAAALARWAAAGLGGAMLAKAEDPETLARLSRGAGPDCALLPLIESLAGWDAADVLAAAPGVCRLVFGHLDFQQDLGLACGPDEAELAPVRLALVAASRRAGLAPPVDGVTTAIDDAGRLASDAGRALCGGFGAKLCIHPRQVAPVEAAFAPSPEASAWAARVVEAMRASQGGAARLDGRMVDAPVLRQAERILARTASASVAPGSAG